MKLVAASLLLLSVLPTPAHAADDSDTAAVAEEAGVAPVDLEGALNTLAAAGITVSAREYVQGGVSAPVAASSDRGWPIGGALGQRLYCLEGRESQHNGSAVNRSSGAAGWLQWLPSTARQWGVTIGNRSSEWRGAAQIAAQGERFFRSQWVPLQLGLC